jgi:hypothetical protein
MPAFLLGVVALLLLLWAASAFSKADPKQVARLLRGIGGVAALLLAAFLLVRAKSQWRSRSEPSGWVCSVGRPFGPLLLGREHKKAPAGIACANGFP